MKMISLAGIGVKVPDVVDCDWCGAHEACRFKKIGYDKPCDECKKTKKYKDLQKAKESVKSEVSGGISKSFARREAAAVYEGGGRQIVTNKLGEIIKNVPYKPRPAGIGDEVNRL